jgi:hypothetical protein
LRIRGESSRNTFTVGNGNRPGVIPERGGHRETGTSRGYLAPAGGEAPSISYMEGASLFPRPLRALCQESSAGLPAVSHR